MTKTTKQTQPPAEWSKLVSAKDVSTAFQNDFAYLADSPDADILLAAVAHDIKGAAVIHNHTLAITFSNDTLLCGLPRASDAEWPAPFAAFFAKHKYLMLEKQHLILGETDLACADDLVDAGFAWLSLVENINDLRCPLEDGSDWWLFHPTENNDHGQPELCLLSHEDLRIAERADDNIGTVFLRRLINWLQIRVVQPVTESVPPVDWGAWFDGLDDEWRKLLARKLKIDSGTIAEQAGKFTELHVKHHYNRQEDKTVKVYHLKTLEPLYAMHVLEDLSLQEQLVQDYSPVASLTYLRKLSLHGAPYLKDVGFVSNLHRLCEIYLDSAPLHELRPLLMLPALKVLQIYHCRVETVETIASVSKLKTLEIYHCPVKAIEGIACLSKLESLTISHGKLSDIRGVEKLRRLQFIDISEMPISDLSPLSGLPDLESVNISGTEVVSLAPLQGLPELDSLNVCKTLISLREILQLVTTQEAAGQDVSITSDYIYDPALLTQSIRADNETIRAFPDAAARLVAKCLFIANPNAKHYKPEPEVLELIRAIKSARVMLNNSVKEHLNEWIARLMEYFPGERTLDIHEQQDSEITITVAMIKELRERTGLGMIECKKALSEAGGDIEEAIELLCLSGKLERGKYY